MIIFITEEEVYMIEQLQRAGQRREACMEFLTLILRREDKKEIQENVDKLVNAFREEGIKWFILNLP